MKWSLGVMLLGIALLVWGLVSSIVWDVKHPCLKSVTRIIHHDATLMPQTTVGVSPSTGEPVVSVTTAWQPAYDEQEETCIERQGVPRVISQAKK
jgi:hypothetical protein